MEDLDPAERGYLEEEDSSLMKTFKGATAGLVAGTIWGTVVATWYDVPRVERSVALPGPIRTFKTMGSYGMTFAAIGGVYIGVEQLVQNYRMKRDLVNGVVGGFVADATILGYRVRNCCTPYNFRQAPPLYVAPVMDVDIALSYIQTLLGRTYAEAYKETDDMRGAMSIEFLINTYDDRRNEGEWDYAARAFIMLLLACTILPDMSHIYIDVK